MTTTFDRKLTPRDDAFINGKVMSSDQVRPRPGRDAEQTKRDILLAGLHEFSEYGDSGARIDRIAHRADANKSLIYAYFGNKEELYAHALREAYAQIRTGEAELDLQNLEPRAAIRKLIQFTMEHFRSAPWFLRMLATENLRRGQTIRQISDIASLQSPLITHLSAALESGANQVLFRRDINAADLYILIASILYFPISNSHTLSVGFGVPVHQTAWLEKRLQLAEDMIIGYLEETDERPPT